MKLYPPDIEAAIGMDQIRDLLHSGCSGNRGRELVDRMSASSSARQVRLWHVQTAEYVHILSEGNGPPVSTSDIRSTSDKLSVNNLVLEAEELLVIRLVSREALETQLFFEKRREACPELYHFAADIGPPETIVEAIDGVFDNDGNWKKNATKKLADVLNEIEKTERNAYRELNKIYEKARKEAWIADTGITVKEGRLVLPVFAENKKRIPGIVHDESGGGKVLYIEPLEVLEFSNQIRELEMERDREMRRILTKLTDKIRPFETNLKNIDFKMGVLDFVRSKARLARSLDAEVPEIKPSGINYQCLYHPILKLHHKKSGKHVVPMKINLDHQNRLMVVSGPNAGGKSVAIKTLVLNQYMAQCGMLIPCAPGDCIRLFKKIFVDIGDNQSIENDLSSYSSHLTAMKHFIEHSDPSTLVIIDEIGSGTDPNFGGGMAEAVLLNLNQKQVMGMVTTHFGNVKSLSDQTEGMINGSMLYDVDRLQPLYQLRTGIPGSSFALEVASHIGLDRKIIELAKKRSNTVQHKTDELLSRLELEREQNKELKAILESERRFFERLKHEYSELKKGLEGARKEILEDARKKALMIMEGANSVVEQTVKEIREVGGDKFRIKKARNKLEVEREKLITEGKKALDVRKDQATPKLRSRAKEVSEPPELMPLAVGVHVRMPNSEAIGEVIEIKKDKALVVAGIMKSYIPLDQLEVVSRREKKKSVRLNYDLIKAQADFVMEKDVRGMRSEEALKEIDSWIDRAIVVGSPQLRLIHGKGDGILKKVIRDYYRNSAYVKRIKYEAFEHGGEGVSVIELVG